MFDSNDTNTTFLNNDVWQSTLRYTPFNAQSIQNTISQVPFFFNTVTTEDLRLDTYCPMYPCPHKDLFHIARQIDKIHDLECQYRYDSCTFIIKDTERNRTLGILGKDTKANQIILQCGGYSDRFIRLITLDLDCDLLALVQMDSSIRGLYRVNSVE